MSVVPAALYIAAASGDDGTVHAQTPDGMPAGPLLAVSAHLDDAVMSSGATLAALAEAGREVVVFTVFAGHPQPPLSAPALEFHADCGLGDDAVAVRRAEDVAACAAIGARARHGEHADALYRRLGEGWLCERLGEHLDPRLAMEPEVVAAVEAELAALLAELRPAAVWTGAGLGDHVDHRIVRAAAEAACARHGVALAEWEDLPYAFGRRAPARGPDVLRGHAGERHLRAKLDAIACYPSQLRMLFGTGADWRALFAAHARSRLGQHGTLELVWRAGR